MSPLKPTEFHFFCPKRQNLLVKLPADLNCIKSKSYSKNNNLNNKVDIDNRVNTSDKVVMGDGIGNKVF